MSYCPKCGGTGILLDGTPCDCKISPITFNQDLVTIDVPEVYQGIEFSKELIDPSMNDYYKNYMQNLHDDIVSMKMKHSNILICAPSFTSKTVLAYSAIQKLFHRGIDVFPVYDVLEIRKMTTDLDLNKKSSYSQSNPEDILRVPYLFVKMPAILLVESYQMMALLVDRRTRRNNSTIFIYNGDYKSLESQDYRKVLPRIVKDGSYGSIKLMEFWRTGDKDGETGS